MSKQEWKGGALLAPLPAVIVTSAREGEKPNAITIAWCGIISTHPPALYISVRPSRHSYEIIKETGEFCVNLVPVSLVRAADTCGVLTGRKVDKFEKCKLTKSPASTVGCPLIEECPMSLECKVTDIVELGSHHMFIADITAINVDESLLGDDGKLHLEKAKLAAFAHGEYYELGKKIGNFGFSVKKKKRK
jgi:flavin reductase (DIM6/NTAB) family NADH-FMN oxidoreductase RutF